MPELNPLSRAAREMRTNRAGNVIATVALAWAVIALGIVAWNWLVGGAA